MAERSDAGAPEGEGAEEDTEQETTPPDEAVAREYRTEPAEDDGAEFPAD